MNLHYCSAIALAGAIARGETTAVEALELCLVRIEEFDPTLNAGCNRVDTRARQRAELLDRAATRNDFAGPLHGVPMTVKEGYDLVGTPTTWGREDHRENFPTVDAHAVQRLEAAGAVVFGKTNVPTVLRDWQSVNPLYGRTVNPWDIQRTPGGLRVAPRWRWRPVLRFLKQVAISVGVYATQHTSAGSARINRPTPLCQPPATHWGTG